MEKPRKKDISKTHDIYSQGLCVGWNEHADAMSAWIEGAIKEINNEISSLVRDYSGMIGSGNYSEFEEELSKLLTQRLGGGSMKERVKNFYPKMWDVHCKEEAEALPVEKRQEFMDYMTKERMSIGEAAKKADLNFDQAAGIMMMQIKSRTYFDYEAHA